MKYTLTQQGWEDEQGIFLAEITAHLLDNTNMIHTNTYKAQQSLVALPVGMTICTDENGFLHSDDSATIMIPREGRPVPHRWFYEQFFTHGKKVGETPF